MTKPIPSPDPPSWLKSVALKDLSAIPMWYTISATVARSEDKPTCLKNKWSAAICTAHVLRLKEVDLLARICLLPACGNHAARWRKSEIIKNQSLHKAVQGSSYDFSRTLEQLGSLSNDKDEDGSDLLNLSNVGFFFLSWILKFQTRKKNSWSWVHVSHRTSHYEVSLRSRALDVTEIH